MQDAWRLFDKMPSGDVVTWNVVGLGHVKCGQKHTGIILTNASGRCVASLYVTCFQNVTFMLLPT
jgi:hypothetical protein